MIIIVSSVPEATLKELHGHDCVRHENVIICDDSVKEKLESLQSIQYMCEVISENGLELDTFPILSQVALQLMLPVSQKKYAAKCTRTWLVWQNVKLIIKIRTLYYALCVLTKIT